MSQILNIMLLGTIWGAVYSLIAVGFSLIFGVARIVNFAHGSYYMLGAYLSYVFINVLNLNAPLSFFLTISITFLFGMMIDRLLINHRRHNHAYILILTLAIAMVMQEIAYTVFGPNGKSVNSFIKGSISLLDVNIVYQKVIIVLVATILILALYFFIRSTKTGKSVMAVAQNEQAAILMGIQPSKVYMITMGVSATLAAVAGILIAPILDAVPNMWIFPLFKAFAIVIIGGLGSIGGAIISAMLLGYSETIVSLYLSVKYSDAIYLIAIILVLLIRPMGIFGNRMK